MPTKNTIWNYTKQRQYYEQYTKTQIQDFSGVRTAGRLSEPHIYRNANYYLKGAGDNKAYHGWPLGLTEYGNDLIRYGMHLLSPRGIVFIGKQFLLQSFNRRIETGIFNPIATLISRNNIIRFKRILDFSVEKRTVTVEAGIMIGELQDFLLPHRLMLPVLPGHPQISVGGCIACNVHGKNTFKNKNFCDWVEEVTLLRSSGAMTSLKRKSQGFSLTCGGFGLTGLIISATIKLQKLPLRTMEKRIFSVESLVDTQKKW